MIKRSTKSIDSFIPGSEWLYLKVYCGPQMANDVINNQLKKIIKTVDKPWFFIRYNDPDFHLRIRIKASKEEQYRFQELIHLHFDTLLKQRVVWKLQYDTYQRENERYTKELIDFSEHLFYLQSQYFVFKDDSFFDRDHELKFFESIKILDSFVSVFLISDEDKLNFYKIVYESFKHEFQNSKVLTKELNQYYKDVFSEKLSNKITFDIKLNDFTNKIKNCLKVYNIELEKFPINVLSSHTHMLVNRYFTQDQRKYEYMIYHHLFKLYSEKKWHNKTVIEYV